MVRPKHACFGCKKVNSASYTGAHNLQNEIMDVEQITKADRLRVSRPLQKRQIPRHATAA